jgi:hypothetical protein
MSDSSNGGCARSSSIVFATDFSGGSIHACPGEPSESLLYPDHAAPAPWSIGAHYFRDNILTIKPIFDFALQTKGATFPNLQKYNLNIPPAWCDYWKKSYLINCFFSRAARSHFAPRLTF